MSNLRTAAQQALEALENIYLTLSPESVLAKSLNLRITALRAALAEPVQEPVAWVPVTEALPKSGVKVLACYRNRLGNLRRIRAMWTAAKTEEADSDDAEACSEYDEATDTYYVTEGWYECIDNWGDYSSVAVCEGEVTHWMPLPPDPDTAPPQRPAEHVPEGGGNLPPPWPAEPVQDHFPDITKMVQEPVASIYITPNGAREFDDWRHDLPVGSNLLYTTPPQRDALVKALRKHVELHDGDCICEDCAAIKAVEGEKT
jgi:hypothetical protein